MEKCPQDLATSSALLPSRFTSAVDDGRASMTYRASVLRISHRTHWSKRSDKHTHTFAVKEKQNLADRVKHWCNKQSFVLWRTRRLSNDTEKLYKNKRWDTTSYETFVNSRILFDPTQIMRGVLPASLFSLQWLTELLFQSGRDESTLRTTSYKCGVVVSVCTYATFNFLYTFCRWKHQLVDSGQ